MQVKTKEWILGILTVVGTIGMFWIWRETIPLIISGEFGNYQRFLYAMTAFVVGGSLFSLSALFIDKGIVVYGAVVLGVGVPFFFIEATGTVLVALGISIMLASWAVYRVRREIMFSVGFSAGKFIKSGLPLFFTAASLVISLFYLHEVDEGRIFDILFPRPVMDASLRILSFPLQSITGIDIGNPNDTIDSTIKSFITSQLADQGVSPDTLSQINMGDLVAKQRDDLAEYFGLMLEGTESTSEVFYTVIAVKTEELLRPYAAYLPAASAIAFFFALKAVTFPLYFITLLVVYIIIKLMRASRMLILEMRQVEVEKLTL